MPAERKCLLSPMGEGGRGVRETPVYTSHIAPARLHQTPAPAQSLTSACLEGFATMFRCKVCGWIHEGDDAAR